MGRGREKRDGEKSRRGKGKREGGDGVRGKGEVGHIVS